MQMMSDSIFLEIEFLLLVVFSIVLPAIIFAFISWKKAISRPTVLLFGIVLIMFSGIYIALLQILEASVKATGSVSDNKIFASELSIALYLLPAVLAGIGINLASHILIGHLVDAEKHFDREHPDNS
ncbi:MAG: hypothetical protein ACXWT3_11185 [Methylococcaceae bacterium]